MSIEAEITRAKKTIPEIATANLNISSAFGSSTFLNIYLKIVSNLLNKTQIGTRYFYFNSESLYGQESGKNCLTQGYFQAKIKEIRAI